MRMKEGTITEQDAAQPTGDLASGTTPPLLQGPAVVWMSLLGCGLGSALHCKLQGYLEAPPEGACLPACPHSGCLPGASLLVLSRTGLQLVLSFSKVAFVCTFPFLSP